MLLLNDILSKFRSNHRLNQIVSLLSVNIINIPLGIITSILITRYLGAKIYGDYMFIYNIIGLAVILGTFGFFYAGNRAIILSKKKEEIKEYYGAEIIISLGLFLIISISLLFYTVFDSNINAKGLTSKVLLIIPFVWVNILIKYFEVLFQADNKIKLLAQTRLYPKIIFTITVLLIYFMLKDFPFSKLLLIYYSFSVSQILVFIYIIFKLELSFKNFRLRCSEIWNYNKSYGFHVYIGSLFAVGFAQLSAVLISYFGVDNSGVGFYSLALAIASPLSFIPNTIATTHYKEFSELDKVPKKVLLSTLGITSITLIISWLVISPFVNYFYGNEFKKVINLFYVVSIGVSLNGLADFFNRFLGAHGEGKMLRNSSFLVGVSLLVFNLTLIPLWGEVGAAYTNGLTGLVYLLTILYYYNRSKLKLKN